MAKKSSNAPVRVAVVGLGFMGVTHLRAHLDNPAAKVAAVCDAVRLPVNGVLKGVAGNIKKSDDINLGSDVAVCKQLDEVLALPDIDLVDLCTPTPLHMEQAIAVLRAGKHVLCEKPMARTSAQARKIIAAEKASRRFLMPAMCMRFWPGWAWLKEVVAKKQFGKVLGARFRRVTAMPKWSKQGTYGADLGGALYDLHIHDTDFVQFLFGRPASVYSAGVIGATGSIDHVSTQYNYPKGPAVYAEGNWLLAAGFEMSYTIYCERATIDFDLSRGANALRISEQDKEPRIVPCEGDGYIHEIRYAIDCVQKGKRPTIVTSADGMTALEICEAEERSVRTGKIVTLR